MSVQYAVEKKNNTFSNFSNDAIFFKLQKVYCLTLHN